MPSWLARARKDASLSLPMASAIIGVVASIARIARTRAIFSSVKNLLAHVALLNVKRQIASAFRDSSCAQVANVLEKGSNEFRRDPPAQRQVRLFTLQKLNVCFPLFHILARWLAQENATQRGQSSTAGLGSIIGALMVLAPRIMRGELDKLPKKHLSDGSVGQPRSDADMAQLQRRLTDEKGIGEDIICDFLHDIPGFTRATDTCRRTGQAAGDREVTHGTVSQARSQADLEKCRSVASLLTVLWAATAPVSHTSGHVVPVPMRSR
jgi:hypothetical protein